MEIGNVTTPATPGVKPVDRQPAEQTPGRLPEESRVRVDQGGLGKLTGVDAPSGSTQARLEARRAERATQREADYQSKTDRAEHLQQVREKLDAIAKSISEGEMPADRRLQFSVDESTKRIQITVSDKETGKVIRQVPSDTLLRVADSLEALKGLLYDDHL